MPLRSKFGLKYVLSITGLAVADFAGASLGKLMAIPPGNVTPLWPPSGIAFSALLLLGNRFWPGVFLGSFAFNAAFFYQQHHYLDVSGWCCSAGIAAGSTLQALAGVYLVRKRMPVAHFELSLDGFLKRLLLAGPVACITAASFGCACLFLAQAVTAEAIPNLWMTWWFGDTSGVLLLGGIIVGSTQQFHKKENYTDPQKNRMIHIASAMLLTLVIGGTLWFWQLLKSETTQVNRKHFEQLTNEALSNLNARLLDYQDVLHGAAGFVQATPTMQWDRWSVYLRSLNLQQRYPGLQSVIYHQGVKPPEIKNTLIPFPNDWLLNQFNFKGKALGKISISAPVQLQEGSHLEKGFWLFMPVYNLQQSDVNKLQGWVAACFINKQIFANIVESPDIEVSIYDGQIGSDYLVYSNITAKQTAFPDGFTRNTEFLFGGRKWIMVWQSRLTFENSNGNPQAPFVLFFGLFSSLLLGFLLLNLNTSRERAMQMVHEATLELAEKNVLLQESYAALENELAQRLKKKRIIKEISRRNELILNSMTEGIFGFDANGKVQFINESGAHMLGCTVDEVLAANDTHLTFHHTRSDGSPYPQEECMILLASKGSVRQQISGEIFWRQDGTGFPVEYSVTPVFQDGQYDGVVVVFQDISEKVRQEELLQEADMRFEAVFNQSYQFIGLMSPNGMLIEANRSALAAIGLELKDLTHCPFWETPWWQHSRVLQDKIREGVEKARQKEFVRFEASYPSPSGEMVILDFSLKPLLNEAGEVVLLIPEGRDITALKRIEEEHREMVEQLQEVARMRRNFVSTLTHDLKTPLIAQGRVLGSLQNEKAICDDRHLSELITGFMQNNSGLLLMVNNLLETYELEDGRMKIIPEPLSLYDLAEECHQELQELLDTRLILLENQIPPDFPTIEADALLLKRIFQNLISNAIANIPNGSHIWLQAEDWENCVDISVVDNGPGIPKDLLSHLFSRYLSGASTRKKIGSGLGLYICKMISELHGGTIRVDSKPEQGTKISFTLWKEIKNNVAE